MQVTLEGAVREAGRRATTLSHATLFLSQPQGLVRTADNKQQLTELWHLLFWPWYEGISPCLVSPLRRSTKDSCGNY